MIYNLTDRQKEVIRWIVAQARLGVLNEEFLIVWTQGRHILMEFRGDASSIPEIGTGTLDALVHEDLLHCSVNHRASRSGTVYELSRRCTITGRAYEAVDGDFSAPDTSFVRNLTPLAEISGFDQEIVKRVLPVLGAGAADPALWDSAVRTAGVILEERMRDVGGITERDRVGRDLVNSVFGDRGTLSPKFESDSERQGYRDLYAGVVGAFRNPSAHRIIDPSPADGGAFIVFVNLLLRRLDELR